MSSTKVALPAALGVGNDALSCSIRRTAYQPATIFPWPSCPARNSRSSPASRGYYHQRIGQQDLRRCHRTRRSGSILRRCQGACSADAVDEGRYMWRWGQV